MEVRPVYKQTEVGVIPEDWAVSTISKSMRLINGCAFKPHEWRKQGVPIIRIQNLNDPAADFNYFQGQIDERNRVVEGDVLFAWSGTLGSSFGARIWSGPDGVLNQHIFKVIADERVFTKHYSYLIFKRVQDDIEKKSHGFKSSFVHVKKADIDNIQLPIPPLPEQRAIAVALSDVDALLAKLDQLIAKKRDLKQATMQQLLTGQTRLPGFSGEWEVKRLGDVADIDTDNLGSNTASNYEFNYISLENVDCGVLRGWSEQVFYAAPSRARRRLKKGDILVSTVRPNLQSHLHFKTDSPHWVCSTGFAVVRCRTDVTNPAYVFPHLFGASVSRQIDTLLTGSSYPAINSRDVRALEIPSPSYDEQTAIATVLSDMDAELAALEARRDKTRALKQGMMQELLTGRIRLV